jgi:hypothetical protein
MARCRVFVLVFTDHANDSEHVGREVANAFSLGLAVIHNVGFDAFGAFDALLYGSDAV